MDKITRVINHRPKGLPALTEPNKNYNHLNKTSCEFPSIKDKIKMQYLNSFRNKRKFQQHSHNNFFMLSTPFNFYRSKNNKNEFFVHYNGGPTKKFFLSKKNLKLDLSRINSYSNRTKYRLKSSKICPTTIYDNNKKDKNKFNYLYNHFEEEKNNKNNNICLNSLMNTKKNITKLTNTDINVNIKDEEKDNKIDKEKEDNNRNIFKLFNKPKFRFHKIQIHNNCKPYLVDDYRYYAEKYL